jgi:hypothetical protein
METRTADETAAIAAFIQAHFGAAPLGALAASDEPVIAEILAYVEARFSRMKYILGLAIDFTLLAQEINRLDQAFCPLEEGSDAAAVFAKYPLVEQRGERQANTLTLSVGATAVGIRKFEERVADVFHAMERSKYPSAYVYNTGQWKKYTDLLALCFRLSAAGRQVVVGRLFDFGLERLDRNAFFGRDEPRVRVFEKALSGLPRDADGENGGLTLQAMVFGFLRADHHHLEWIADKVRTGSARQRRFGDIDGYSGLNLEVSAEVKDLDIDATNKERQLGSFIESVKKHEFLGMVFARSFTQEVRDELEALGLVLTDNAALKSLVARWDWAKQDIALYSMLHYLAHIEQNALAVRRFLKFIAEHDELHPSLV